MKLDAVTAELRPRSDWEAVDLGIALVRRDFRRVIACWWAGMLPALIPAAVLLYQEPLWILLVAWWWTPVASRMVLFYLSRHLFGERPTWRDIARQLPKAMVRRFFFRMILARFSPWRPLTMAVEDLEGLRGAVYRQRAKLLLRRGDSTLIMVALWRLVILFGLVFAMFQMALMLMPQGQTERWSEVMQEWNESGWVSPPPVILVSLVISTLISMCVTDLFATGIGFGVYVNHRTWIEGWDVEIALKRLGSRLRQMTAALLIGLLSMGMISPSHAKEPLPETPPEEHEGFAPSPPGKGLEGPEKTMAEIKSHPDFVIQKVKVPNPKSSKTPPPSSAGGGGWIGMLGALAGVVGWTILALAVAAVVFALYKFRHLFGSFRVKGDSGRVAPSAKVVMGMEVTPESLPKDIPAMALELWQAGRFHEAMSLLYRGAISRLITSSNVEIAESDTESDCLRRVAVASPSHEPYFNGLTQVWMRLAYAKLIPQEGEMQSLCSTWPFAALERRGR